MSDEAASSDIVGKKVFFLYPQNTILIQIIPELVQQEYEVYVAKDHNRLPRVLKRYKEAVVFINIDEGQPEAEWEKWIGTVTAATPGVLFGIFSSNSSDDLKDKYLNKIKVSCGYMALKHDMSKAAETVLEVLKVMNIKGRRKYLRASPDRDTIATVNIPYANDYVNGTLKDISTVGFSCVLENNPDIHKNSLQKDIQLKLQSMLLKVEAVVFGSRTEGPDKIYVFLFTQKVDGDVRSRIRKYIQQTLQGRMDNEMV